LNLQKEIYTIVEIEIYNNIIVSTNSIYYTNRYYPLFLNSSFIYPFEHTISINGLDYLFVSTNLMHLYEEKLSTCNIPDDFHEEVLSFVSGIKNMTPKQLKDKIVGLEYNNPSFSILSIEPSVVDKGCNQLIDWFNENYKSLSFSVLYSLKGAEFNSSLGNEYVDDDSLVMDMEIKFKHSSRGVDSSEIQLIYVGGVLKYLIISGGE